jgi:hypothetical protein
VAELVLAANQPDKGTLSVLAAWGLPMLRESCAKTSAKRLFETRRKVMYTFGVPVRQALSFEVEPQRCTNHTPTFLIDAQKARSKLRAPSHFFADQQIMVMHDHSNLEWSRNPALNHKSRVTESPLARFQLGNRGTLL